MMCTSLLFDVDAGLATAPDETTMNERLARLQDALWDADVELTNFLNQNILPQIVTNLELMWSSEDSSGAETALAAATGRAALPSITSSSCRPTQTLTRDQRQSTADLIDHLSDCVRSQYADVVQAMFGFGSYRLAPAVAHHGVTYTRWARLTERKQAALFTALMADIGREGGSDGAGQQEGPPGEGAGRTGRWRGRRGAGG